MGDNAVERMIGRLEAEAEASETQRAELFAKVSELREDMHQGFTALRDLLVPLTGLPAQVAEDRRRIDELQVRHARQSGGLWAAGAIGGLIAGGAAMLVRLADVMKLFGGKG